MVAKPDYCHWWEIRKGSKDTVTDGKEKKGGPLEADTGLGTFFIS